MAKDKWEQVASFVVLFLGFYINSRTMTVTWPFYKRQALYEDIQEALPVYLYCLHPCAHIEVDNMYIPSHQQ
jgi:hypothetical protein